MTDTVHVFERAGLGRAPFRLVGIERRVGPIIIDNADGTRTEIGSPGQPMGACEYCGQGIAECCVIRDADGNQFIVGNQCVGKTGDRGLVSDTKRAINAAARERQLEREGERIRAARLAFHANRDAFEARPHPRGFTDRETGKPLTLGDEIVWMLANAGHAGRLRTAKRIERTLAEIENPRQAITSHPSENK